MTTKIEDAVRAHEAAGCPLARELRVLRSMCSCGNDMASVDEAEARYLELMATQQREAGAVAETLGNFLVGHVRWLVDTDTIPAGTKLFLHPAQAASQEGEKAEAGMLPDTLDHVSREWYELCERAAYVDRIKISGELAEAIVATVCRPAHPAADKVLVTKVERTFRWDSEKQHHIPQLKVEFDPILPTDGYDAKGWKDRDALAAALSPPANGENDRG